MNKNEALAMWRECIKPVVIQFHGKGHKIALRESWNDTVDYLAKDGEITWKQADNWSQPIECK